MHRDNLVLTLYKIFAGEQLGRLITMEKLRGNVPRRATSGSELVRGSRLRWSKGSHTTISFYGWRIQYMS